MRRKDTKLVKESKIIIQQPKNIESPNLVDIKSVIIKHPKTLHKLSKTIRHIKNISQVSVVDKNSDGPLYSEIKKVKIF